MEKFLEVRSLVEHLCYGSTNNKHINDSLELLDNDIKVTMDTLRIVPDYENEDEVFKAVTEGAKTYLEDGINYQAFVNILALVKKYLNLLEDNGSTEYLNRMSLELVNVFSGLDINPYKKVKEVLRAKKYNNFMNIAIPYFFGILTGLSISSLLCYY